MMDVRILADDLTGALDAAAPFAAAHGPLPVFWPPHEPSQGGSFAFDSESRERQVELQDAVLALLGAGVAFKKIDSLLRGTTVREIAAGIASGCFRSIIIAPAFPAQNRITRGGRQFWRPDARAEWQPVGIDLSAELEQRGVELRMLRSAANLHGAGAFIVDAVQDRDLAAIAAAGQQLERPLLWVGSAGLARALAGPPRPQAGLELKAPLLVVIGSHHPVTLAQVATVERAHSDRLVKIISGGPVEPAVDQVALILERQPWAALHFAFPDGTGAVVAGPVFERAFRHLAGRLTRPSALVVTGGATLHRLLWTIGAGALVAQGERSPGIALSRIQGSPWQDALVISKSGGFGAPDLLLRLTDDVKEAPA